MSKTFSIEPNIKVPEDNVIHNPDDNFYINFLKQYYVFTKDGQYLFGSTQPGRRPDRAFYMIPEGYKLGKKQRKFDTKIGKKSKSFTINIIILLHKKVKYLFFLLSYIVEVY